MAGYGLGTARGLIELVYKGGGARNAQNDLEKTKKSAGNVGKGMAIAGAAIAGGFAIAVNKAADFQKGISAIGAVTGATKDQLEQVRAKALQLGADTSFSASEAASAMEELAKAGIPLPDIMNGAADATVALAAAGEIDLPQAATIASNAMNQFHLSAQDMPRIADLFAGAANASAIGVTDLGESMKYVGPVAAGLGVSIDDTTTAIALLGQQGIKGSEAGTALRSVLSNLTPTTKPAIAAFKKLGLITKDGKNAFVDAHGSIKPLNEVMQILNDKTKNLSDTEKNTFTKTAFGLNSMTAAGILAGTTGAAFDKMAGDIAKVKAADVAKARLDNFRGAVEQMKGSLETVAIMVGTIFLPALTKIAQFITALANKFSTLSPAAQKVGAVIGALAAVFLLVGGGILTLISTVGAFGGAFAKGISIVSKLKPILTALRVAFIAMTGPVGLTVIAVAALVAGAIYAYKHFEGFRNVVNTVGAAIKNGLIAAFNALKPAFDSVVAGVIKFIAALKSTGASILNSIKPGIAALIGQFKSLMATVGPIAAAIGGALMVAFRLVSGFINAVVVPALAKFGGFLVGTVIPALGKLAGFILGTVMPILLKIAGFFVGVLLNSVISGIRGIVQVIQGGFQIISGIFRLIVAVLTGNWRAAWEAIKTILKGALNLITGSIRIWLAVSVLKVFAVGMAALRGLFTAGWAAIRAVFTGAMRGAGSTVRGGMNLIRSLISGVMKAIWAIIKGAWNLIVAIVKGYIRAYTAVVRAGFNLAKSVVTGALRAIVSVIRGGFRTALSVARSAVNSIKSAISSAFSAIVSRIRSAGSSMVGAIRNAMSSIVSAARSGGSRLLGAIKSAVSRAVSAVRAMPGKAKAAMGNLGSLLYSAGRDFVMGFVNGIKDMAGAAASAAGDAAKGAVNKAKSFLHIGSPSKVMYQVGKWTSEGFAEGIKDMAPKVAMAAEATVAIAPAAASVAPSATMRATANGGAEAPSAPTQSVTNNIYAHRGMSESEIARQTVIRMGTSMLGKTVPIPAPAGGYR